jgi:hypothetical protein
MRILFNIVLIFSILYCPWWTGAIIVLCACLLVNRFYEVVLYGILADALYGTQFGIHGFAYAASLFTLSIFVVTSLIRSRLAW